MTALCGRAFLCWNINPGYHERKRNKTGCRISSMYLRIEMVSRIYWKWMTTRWVLLSNEMTPQTITCLAVWWTIIDHTTRRNTAFRSDGILLSRWTAVFHRCHVSTHVFSGYRDCIHSETQRWKQSEISMSSSPTPLQMLLSVCTNKGQSV